MLGVVYYHDVDNYYGEAGIVLNVSATGGLDKTVLEAMAAKRLVLSTYSGCADFFKPYDELLIPNENDPESLACKIKEVFEYDKKDIIVEIRTGDGRDEYTLFQAELFRRSEEYSDRK